MILFFNIYFWKKSKKSSIMYVILKHTMGDNLVCVPYVADQLFIKFNLNFQ